MRLLIAIGCVLLMGASCQPRIEYVPTYEPVDIKMPERPMLLSNGGTSYNTIGKNAEKDLQSLKTYSLQLEGLITEVKSKQGKTINKQ